MELKDEASSDFDKELQVPQRRVGLWTQSLGRQRLPRRILVRIRAAIRYATYDVTAHAIEEMAEDALDVADVETAILNGRLVKTDRDDPRGTRYTVHGIGADGITAVGTVGRFTGTGRYLIITAYEILEPRV